MDQLSTDIFRATSERNLKPSVHVRSGGKVMSVGTVDIRYRALYRVDQN